MARPGPYDPRVKLPCPGYLNPSPTPIQFQTAAGQGQGNLARGVQVAFLNDPANRAFRFDCLVTENLNGRGYGLFSLKDVVNHFFIQAEGRLELGTNLEPEQLPDLVLVPRQVWDRVRYVCPHCQIVTWGRAGLHLVCGDGNVPLQPA